jgi:hypothetical protein
MVMLKKRLEFIAMFIGLENSVISVNAKVHV